MDPRPRLFLAALCASAIVVGGGALAWACTPQAYITLSPRMGGPGTTVTVSGRSFVNNGPVEIRWESSTGMLLREARGPNFTVAITIPQSDPGVYSVVATGYDTGGIAKGRTAAPFEVTGAQSGGEGSGESGTAEESSNSTSGEQGGGGENTGGDTSESTSGGGGGSSSGEDSGSSTSTSGGSGGSTSGGYQDSESSSSGGSSGAGFPSESGSTTETRTTATGAGAAPASSNPPVVASATGEVFFGGSVASPLAAETTSGSSGRSQDEAPAAAGVSDSGAFGNLWGGFEQVPPSLAPGLGHATTPADPYPAIGLVLFGFGLVGLFGGALIATVAAPRATARVPSSR